MDADEYLRQSTSRMPPGGVYYTLNELALAAYDGDYEATWKGRDLPLGNAVGRGSQIVYFGQPPEGTYVHSKL